MTDQDNVVDAVVVEDNGASVLLNLESLIREHIRTIDNGKSELKKLRDMLNSALVNSETYRNHEKAAKDAAKLKAATKSQIMKEPATANLALKAQEIANTVKETDAAISDYLREYQRLSGSNEFDVGDGEVRKIVYIAKLQKDNKRKG